MISPYQGSDEEMRKICLSRNESITMSSSFFVGNSEINLEKNKELFDFS
jgi:hypothetical protein